MNPLSESNRKQVLILFFLLALVVRVAAVMLRSDDSALRAKATDAFSYDQYALDMLGHDGLMHANSGREPGFSILLAALYRVFGHNYLAPRLANAILGALTCLILFRLAERAFGYKVAVLATAWAIPYFHFVQYSAFVLREVLLTFLLSAIVLLLLATIEKRSRPTLAFTCVVYLFLVHSDARYLFYAPFLTAYVFFAWQGEGRFRSAALFAAVFVVGMIPWQVRNYVAYDKIVLINTRTLAWSPPWKSNAAEPVGLLHSWTQKAEPESAQRVSWLELGAFNFQEFYRIARLRPEIVAGVKEPLSAWSLEHNVLSILQYGPLVPFFAYGVFLVFWRRVRTAYVFVLVVLLQTGLHTMKWGLSRFRVPIEPILIALAFYGITCIVDAYRNRRPSAPGSGGREA